MKKIVKDALVLFAITLVAGILLGVVYQITLDPIAKANENAKEKAYKAVLAEAQLFAAADGNAVYNAVAGIWNQLHVHRSCRADAGEQDSKQQHQKIRGQKSALIANGCLKQRHKPGKHNAHRDLQ